MTLYSNELEAQTFKSILPWNCCRKIEILIDQRANKLNIPSRFLS